MNPKRCRQLNNAVYKAGKVFYWMSREQRVDDNWSLLFAQDFAKKHDAELAVIFCLVPEFLDATIRQYGFMLDSLEKVEEKLKKKGISFFLLTGNPEKEISKVLSNAGAVFADFDPLKIKQSWKNNVLKKIKIPFFEVDSHNVVPCWVASDKQEYAARTFRPKVRKKLAEFLVEFPKLKKNSSPQSKKVNWKALRKKLKIDFSVKEVSWLKPGEDEAKKVLNRFIKNRLKNYVNERNDPNEDGQSNLSPYLHFGQISSQRVALEVNKSKAPKKAKEAFLEEVIVRKELSDNFCYFNKNYDSIKCAPEWAAKTLDKHKKDKREYKYSLKQFEYAQTHDPLWNAAQLQMVRTGKMHGYMRMYWAKKILEWTSSAEQAMKFAIYLNDKYELDGRDPNGYTGIAWSILGIHDRAWPERKIFGKIRYMSFNGCKNKFNVDEYIKKFS